MVDTKDLKSLPYGSAGSSPAEATKKLILLVKKFIMIAFVMLGSKDLVSASTFYDAILTPLGIKKVLTTDRYVGYSRAKSEDKIEFYLTLPFNKELASAGNGTMLALLASSKSEVNEFHAIAIKKGAANEGDPGPRNGQDYYAYIRDLEGNKLCAYCSVK